MPWKQAAGSTAGIFGIQSMFDLPKILKFTSGDMKVIAENTVTRHKKQISLGRDAHGERFERYSRGYANRKKGGSRVPVTLKDTGKMLSAFGVIKADYKTKELKFRYGIKTNKQGTKMTEHNEGAAHLPQRIVAEDQALGTRVENGIVKDIAANIAKNLSRMTKTKYVVKLG